MKEGRNFSLESVFTRSKSRLSTFGDLLPLINNRGMPFRLKGRLYSGLVLYGSWPVREADVIRLGRNGARMVRWTCYVKLKESNSNEAIRLKLNNMGEG